MDSTGEAVRMRLLAAAQECFLAADYHDVTTRRIAQQAGANVSMIRYYFGNKLGLYEAAVRAVLQPLLDALEGPMLSSVEGFTEFFRLYYRLLAGNPRLPRLIVRILALQDGPGRRLLAGLLQEGRARAAGRVAALQAEGEVDADIDAELLRMSFLSLAVMPVLLADILRDESPRARRSTLLEELARFNGDLFARGLAPRS